MNEEAKPYIYAAEKAAENARLYNDENLKYLAIHALEEAQRDIQSALDELNKEEAKP